MGQISITPAIVVLLAGLVAALTDIWRFKVYNVLTFPLVLSGLAFHGITGGAEGLGASMGGVLFGFVILLVPYLMGAMGAGDVKFVAGVGAWLGTEPLLVIVIIGGIAAAVYGVGLMVYYGRYRDTWINFQLLLVRLTTIGRQFGADDQSESVQDVATQNTRRHRLIPFSAMISVGVFVTFLMAVWRH